jgi:hypothetical protein
MEEEVRTSLESGRQGWLWCNCNVGLGRCQRPHPMEHISYCSPTREVNADLTAHALNAAACEEMLRKSDGVRRRRMRLETGGGRLVEADQPPMLPS